MEYGSLCIALMACKFTVFHSNSQPKINYYPRLKFVTQACFDHERRSGCKM